MVGSSINPNTGGYSRGASEVWVFENGEMPTGERMHRPRATCADMLMTIRPRTTRERT